MKMPSPSLLQPEFFALLGTDLFLALSLLTCLLDNRFPKAIPYIYQAAALVGFGHLLASRDLLGGFGEYTRFWYCLFYLTVALANIVGVNVYLAAIKRQYKIARLWSGIVTFPSMMISIFFVAQYGLTQNMIFPPVHADQPPSDGFSSWDRHQPLTHTTNHGQTFSEI